MLFSKGVYTILFLGISSVLGRPIPKKSRFEVVTTDPNLTTNVVIKVVNSKRRTKSEST